MEINKILVGDNIETLKTLPDNSVHCCITSPPYYGLRDYGTGKWIGGDLNCDHKLHHTRKNSVCGVGSHSRMEDDDIPVGSTIIKTICPKCGAIREDKQIGLEETPEEYVERLVEIFREVKRILRDDGTLWLNIGESYAGGQGRWGGTNDVSDKQNSNNGSITQIENTKTWEHDIIKPKDLIGVPWMLAFALRADGWYLRSDIIWHKPNPMPESVKDRCTKTHEYIFMLSKSSKYYFDWESIQEDAISDPDRYNYPIMNGDGEQTGIVRPNSNPNTGGMKTWTGKRNKRDVWTINVSTFKGAHFATFPEELVVNCMLAGCPRDGIVLDPFFGSGTVGVVAKKHHRNYIGCELNEEYVNMAKKRLKYTPRPLF